MSSIGRAIELLGTAPRPGVFCQHHREIEVAPGVLAVNRVAQRLSSGFPVPCLGASIGLNALNYLDIRGNGTFDRVTWCSMRCRCGLEISKQALMLEE